MILLTGATGFLGRHIADELLAGGYEVRLLVRDAETRSLPWGSLVEVVDGDLLDVVALGDAVQGVEAVVHAGALVSFRKRDRDLLLAVNVTGTANLVDACLEAGVPRLIHISSIGALGRQSDGAPITERTPWQDKQVVSTYALSKRKAEREVLRGVAEGLWAAILNPALILGPGDWRQGTPRIFAMVQRGLRFYNSGGTGLVAARDVARACLHLLHADTPAGERFILSAESLTYRELLAMIATELGKTPPAYKLPPRLMHLTGWIAEKIDTLTGWDLGLTYENMRSASRVERYDGSKIERTGFSYTPIQQVVAETVEKLRADVHD
ncbi:MAG: SDR family oxidoreductase [Bacteroidia bacterium]